MSTSIIPIPAFNDNYIWCYLNTESRNCFVVDPGDAAPVLHYLDEHSLTLTEILLTHHHYDHTGGVKKLASKTNAKIYGPADSPFSLIDVTLKEEDTLTLTSVGVEFQILGIPGHTLDHIAYYNAELLFCGDTLFSGGCGRIFEGTPLQMYNSLMKLKALPADTKVYCAHEYTVANLEFAMTVEPGNTKLMNYNAKAKQLRQQAQPTLPSNLALECNINPFLRCHAEEIIKNAEDYSGNKLDNPIDVFTVIRAWKNAF